LLSLAPKCKRPRDSPPFCNWGPACGSVFFLFSPFRAARPPTRTNCHFPFSFSLFLQPGRLISIKSRRRCSADFEKGPVNKVELLRHLPIPSQRSCSRPQNFLTSLLLFRQRRPYENDSWCRPAIFLERQIKVGVFFISRSSTNRSLPNLG